MSFLTYQYQKEIEDYIVKSCIMHGCKNYTFSYVCKPYTPMFLLCYKCELNIVNILKKKIKYIEKMNQKELIKRIFFKKNIGFNSGIQNKVYNYV